MTPLTTASLSSLDPAVAVPGYDRGTVRAGIVHLGVGAFHRAHQALYLDRLMNAGQGLDWGICGVGVLPGDARMRDALHAQDCLYTLVEKSPDGSQQARVIGSIVEYLLAPDDPEAVVEKMADAAIKIVSLTVTEGGYNFHAVTGEFQADNPGVRARPRAGRGAADDVRPGRRGARPASAARHPAVHGAVLRQHPGQRATPPAAASPRSPGCGTRSWASGWSRRCGSPTAWSTASPRSPPTTTAPQIAERFGVEDKWPVVCEPFTQWVLEDNFGLGRPPLEDAGAQVVDDVEPYELMKLRLLNASHQALCYFGYLAGYRLVHDVCQDPLFAEFLLAYMDREATPTLPPVPGIDLHAYKRQLIERFSNPQVRDTVARLCAESSDRIPKWLLPVIRHNLEHDGRDRPGGAGRGGAGRATPRASTSRASRSRSSTGWPTR